MNVGTIGNMLFRAQTQGDFSVSATPPTGFYSSFPEMLAHHECCLNYRGDCSTLVSHFGRCSMDHFWWR